MMSAQALYTGMIAGVSDSLLFGGLMLLVLILALAGARVMSWRQEKAFREACQALPESSRIFKYRKEGVGHVPPGLWTASLGNRMCGLLHLKADGSFLADMTAFDPLGWEIARTEYASGTWLARGNGLLFQVENGAPNLPFASALTEVLRASNTGFVLGTSHGQFEFVPARLKARRLPGRIGRMAMEFRAGP